MTAPGPAGTIPPAHPLEKSSSGSVQGAPGGGTPASPGKMEQEWVPADLGAEFEDAAVNKEWDEALDKAKKQNIDFFSPVKGAASALCARKEAEELRMTMECGPGIKDPVRSGSSWSWTRVCIFISFHSLISAADFISRSIFLAVNKDAELLSQSMQPFVVTAAFGKLLKA